MIRRLAFGLVGIAIIAVSGIAIANVLDNDLPGGNPVIVVPGVLGTFSPTEFQVLLQANPVAQRLLLGRVSAKYDLVGAANPDRGDWQIHKTYSPWLERLEDEGYTPGVDLFVFPYDSMQSMNINASHLGELVDYVRNETHSEKVDIVAHSMGGLVARTYVSSAAADGKIDQLITFGTPHHGTPGAYLIWEGGTVERWFTWSTKWDDPIVEGVIEEYLQEKAKTWMDANNVGWHSILSPAGPLLSEKEFHHGLFHALQDDGVGIGDMLPTDPYLIDRDTGVEKKNACTDQDAYPVNTFLCGLFDEESMDRLGAVDFVTVYSDTPKSTYVAFRVAPVDDPFHGSDTPADEDHVNGPPPGVRRQWEHGDPFKSTLTIANLDDKKGAGDGKIPAYSSEMERDLDTAVDCPQPKLKHAELATKTADLLLRILRRSECVPPLRVARPPRSEPRTRPATGTTDETPSEASPEPVPVPDTESSPSARKPNEPPKAAFEICYLEDCASTHGILTLPDDAVGDLRLIAQPTDTDDENLQVTWLVNGDPVNVSKGPPFAEVPWPIDTLVPGNNDIRLEVTDAKGAYAEASVTVVASAATMPPESQCATDGLIVAGDNGVVVTENCEVRSLMTGRPVSLALDDYNGGLVFQYGSEEVIFGGSPAPYQPIYWWPAGAAEPKILLDEGDQDWATYVLHDTGVVNGNPVVLYTSVFQEIDPAFGTIQATIRDIALDLVTGEKTVLTESWTEDPLDSSIATRIAFTPNGPYSYVVSPLPSTYALCGDEFGVWDYAFEFYDSTGALVSVPNAPTSPCDISWLAHGVPSMDGDKLIYAAPLQAGVIVNVLNLSTGAFVGPGPIKQSIDRIATSDDLLLISSRDTKPQIYRFGRSTQDMAPVEGIADFVRSPGGIQLPGGYEALQAADPGFPWLITPTSVGPIMLGAPAADLEKVTGMPWLGGDVVSGGGHTCESLLLDGHWVYVVAVDGVVVDISLSERGIALTAEGSQVGDDRDSVLQSYGDRASILKGEYNPATIVVDGPENYSYFFDLDNEGVVTDIGIGTGSPLNEGGCS